MWMAFARDYDATDRVVHEWTPDGGASDIDGGYSSTFQYDRAGDLVRVEASTSNAGEDECTVRTYEFDVRGNRTAGGEETSLGECIAGDPDLVEYAFDPYSRQITGADDQGDYVYDEFGRQVSIPGSDSASGEDAMISYFDNDSVQSITEGNVQSVFTLDPSQRRLTETVTGATGSSTVSRHYVNNSDTPAWTTTGATTTANRDTLDAKVSATIQNHSIGAAKLVLGDLAGNNIATVDLSAGTNSAGISSYSAYSEYGADGSLSGSMDGLDHSWQGQGARETSSSGLVLMGARVYNPTTGRFTSTDPIYGGNQNAYSYPSAPTVFSDLSGMKKYPLVTTSDTRVWKCGGWSGIKKTYRKYDFRNTQFATFTTHIYWTHCQVRKIIKNVREANLTMTTAAGIAGFVGGPAGAAVMSLGNLWIGGRYRWANWIQDCDGSPERGIHIWLIGSSFGCERQRHKK
jgi:RHS repeat-associated protein